MKFTPLIVWMIALLAAAPAAAREAAAPATQPEAEQHTEPDVICKRQSVTGSRMMQRVCTTRAQREAAALEVEMLARERRGANVDSNSTSSAN
jgi:hypothetical protein